MQTCVTRRQITGECVHLSSHDLDLDCMTLVLNLDVDVLRMYQHTENGLYRSKQSKVRAGTEKTHTHRHTHRQTDATERFTSRVPGL